MRSILILTAALLCCAPSIAKADEEVCFINNSDADVNIRFFNYGGNTVRMIDMPASSGDRNTCYSVPTINGNSVEGDSRASYLDMGVSTDGAITETLIYSSPTNAIEMSTMPGVSQLSNMGMSFLNPVIGTGSFYYTNPWGGVASNISNSDLEWAQNTLICNKANKVCRYWAHGDDGVYRVFFQTMAPTGYTPGPADENCEDPLSECYNG